ncbi:unnamed protein product, partial [Meganyctiphanes norvegica]
DDAVYFDYNTCNSSKLEKNSIEIIWGPMHITYQILFPIFITMGILLNLAALVILRRTNLAESAINRYFMAISFLNFVLNIFLIPISITNNGCILTSSSATYYAHFGWAIPELILVMRACAVVAIAYDRFLAIYFPLYFYVKNLNKAKIFRTRVIAIMFIPLVFTIPMTYFGSVDICIFNGSLKYIATDSFRPDTQNKFHTVFQGIQESMTYWIPIILLILLNSFIVVAMVWRKVKKSKLVVSGSINIEKFYLTNAVLVMSMMIYLLFQLPSFLYVSNPESAKLFDGLCHNSYGVEAFRAVGNSMDWSLTILHIVPIYMLNKEFKHALIGMLHEYRVYIQSCRAYCSQKMSCKVDDAKSKDNISLYIPNEAQWIQNPIIFTIPAPPGVQV